jgi:hypothetical protein
MQNKFESIRIFQKCKCSERIFKDCININSFEYNLKWGMFNLYYVVFQWNISSSTIASA